MKIWHANNAYRRETYEEFARKLGPTARYYEPYHYKSGGLLADNEAEEVRSRTVYYSNSEDIKSGEYFIGGSFDNASKLKDLGFNIAEYNPNGPNKPGKKGSKKASAKETTEETPAETAPKEAPVTNTTDSIRKNDYVEYEGKQWKVSRVLGGNASLTEVKANGKPGSIRENVPLSDINKIEKPKHAKFSIGDSSTYNGISSKTARVVDTGRQLCEQLGLQAEVITDVDQIPASEKEAIASINKGLKVRAWVGTDGKVYLYAPTLNNEDASRLDIEKLIFHEGIAHIGVKKLMGNEANAFYQNVWRNMGAADKKYFMNYALNTRSDKKEFYQAVNTPMEERTKEQTNLIVDVTNHAADEYIAFISEQVAKEEANKSTLDTIWDFVANGIRKVLRIKGFEFTGNITGAEIAKAILASKKNMEKNAAKVNKAEVANAEKAGNEIAKEEIAEGYTPFSVITDPKLIEELEKGEKVVVYRAMIVDKDGNLNYPMSSKGISSKDNKDNKAVTEHPEFGQWEMSEENPDIVDRKDGEEYGHVTIKDDAGGSTSVAYNPYFHTSLQMLNDQFAKAWRRPNMVVVKCEVPASELKSGYRAQHAKNAVGETPWTDGVVSRTLEKKPRRVILTRYCKPIEVVDMDEYAKSVKKLLEDNDVLDKGIPFSNVTPAQRDALAKAGVPIVEPTGNGKNKASMAAYEEWKNNVLNINDKFNRDIESFDQLPDGYRFDMGMPSAKLLAAGFDDIPIVMRASLVNKKMKDESHLYDVTELKNMVIALQNPIAVFKYTKDNIRNIIVDISQGDKHFLVGITLNYKPHGSTLEINSVSGLFPKDNQEWIKWIQDDKAIAIYEKEKVQKLISSLRINPVEAERIGLNLNLVANVVKTFSNPAIDTQKKHEKFSIAEDSDSQAYKESALEKRKNDYNKALANNDEAEMRRALDAIARLNGYEYQGYHNSISDFDAFEGGHRGNRPEHSLDGVAEAGWFSNEPNKEYGDKEYHSYIKMKNPYTINGNSKRAKAINDEIKKIVEARSAEKKGRNRLPIIQALNKRKAELEEEYNSIEPFRKLQAEAKAIFSQYPEAKTYGEAFRMHAIKHGYDGVKFVDTATDGKYGQDWYMPFKAGNNIKSAELITRDDKANVIPIEKRFSNSSSIRFSIAGETGAKNLDESEGTTIRMDNLKVAEEMEKSGKDAKAIRLATGWERGKEGKWRYEIKDFTLKPDATINRSSKLSKLIDADELFAAYPELKDINVKKMSTRRFIDTDADGTYSDDDKLIEIYLHGKDGALSERELSILLHEVQHAIQYSEGFAKGGSDMSVRLNSYAIYRQLKDLNKKAFNVLNSMERAEAEKIFNERGYKTKATKDRHLSEVLAEARKRCLEYPEYIDARETSISTFKKYRAMEAAGYVTPEFNFGRAKDDPSALNDVYKSIAGEVEARNVQMRNYLEDNERKELSLEYTEDTPRDEQLIINSRFSIADDINEAKKNLSDKVRNYKIVQLEKAIAKIDAMPYEEKTKELLAKRKELFDKVSQLRYEKAMDRANNKPLPKVILDADKQLDEFDELLKKGEFETGNDLLPILKYDVPYMTWKTANYYAPHVRYFGKVENYRDKLFNKYRDIERRAFKKLLSSDELISSCNDKSVVARALMHLASNRELKSRRLIDMLKSDLLNYGSRLSDWEYSTIPFTEADFRDMLGKYKAEIHQDFLVERAVNHPNVTKEFVEEMYANGSWTQKQIIERTSIFDIGNVYEHLTDEEREKYNKELVMALSNINQTKLLKAIEASDGRLINPSIAIFNPNVYRHNNHLTQK